MEREKGRKKGWRESRGLCSRCRQKDSGEGAGTGHHASCHLTNPQITGKATLSISAFGVGILFTWGTGTGPGAVRGKIGHGP